MALKNLNEPKPFVELTAMAKKEMEDIGEALERSEGDIKALEEIGFNVDKLKSMVEMGKKMREVVLKRFT